MKTNRDIAALRRCDALQLTDEQTEVLEHVNGLLEAQCHRDANIYKHNKSVLRNEIKRRRDARRSA